jgi:hypothetical protein
MDIILKNSNPNYLAIKQAGNKAPVSISKTTTKWKH